MANKCSFRKKDGSRCSANAQAANGLCVFHDPARANDGQRARRAGGIARTRTAAVLAPDSPDHPLGSAKEVAAFLGDSINRLRRGELDPRVANAISYSAAVLLRAIEQARASRFDDPSGEVKGGVYMSLWARMARAKASKEPPILGVPQSVEDEEVADLYPVGPDPAYRNPESEAAPLYPETPVAKPVAEPLPVPAGIPAPGESIDEPTELKPKTFAEQPVITIEVDDLAPIRPLGTPAPRQLVTGRSQR